MAQFNERDRRILEALAYDPEAEPAFELIKSCLIWPDEWAEGLSREGLERLNEVWVARGMLHAGRALSEIPTPYRRAWEETLADGVQWPGFRRAELTPDWRSVLDVELRSAEEDEDF